VDTWKRREAWSRPNPRPSHTAEGDSVIRQDSELLEVLSGERHPSSAPLTGIELVVF